MLEVKKKTSKGSHYSERRESVEKEETTDIVASFFARMGKCENED